MKNETQTLLRATKRGMKEARTAFERESRKAIADAKRLRRTVEFSTALGSYRAFPSGAVTRLDSDGDSCETVIEGPPTPILVLASPALTHALTNRLRGGLHGSNLEEVAERLLCEAVREPRR